MKLITLSKQLPPTKTPFHTPYTHPKDHESQKKLNFYISGIRDPGAVGSDNAPRPPNQDLTFIKSNSYTNILDPSYELNMGLLDPFQTTYMNLYSLSKYDASFMDPFHST